MISSWYMSNWVLRGLKKRSLNESHIKRDILSFERKARTSILKWDVCKCKLRYGTCKVSVDSLSYTALLMFCSKDESVLTWRGLIAVVGSRTEEVMDIRVSLVDFGNFGSICLIFLYSRETSNGDWFRTLFRTETRSEDVILLNWLLAISRLMFFVRFSTSRSSSRDTWDSLLSKYSDVSYDVISSVCYVDWSES